MAKKRRTSQKDNLQEYRDKRSASSTPEPFGSSRSNRPRLFVVQKHKATRLHYDFRLEWGGTLVSWAVPKRPSYNPRDKRLAVRVEDHPVEYADFEGVIPKDNYGAGPVIVWDMGLWNPLDPVDEALERGVLHFELQGYKLKGIWMLVRTQGGSPKDWLLIKKKDAYSKSDDADNPPDECSIFSGLTLDELEAGDDRSPRIAARLKRARAKAWRVRAKEVKLMLAQTADAPFSGADWIFELKVDGWRVLAERDPEGRPFLRSRNGHDLTHVFPDIARAVRGLPYPGLVLDGELTCLDPAGRPDFGRLQQRAKLHRARDVEQAAVQLPAAYFVFDLLGFDGYDLRPLPLLQRKDVLAQLIPKSGPLKLVDFVEEHGKAMYESIRELGLEGVMAKRANSTYVGGRTGKWLKIPVAHTRDLVVCGFTAPKGSRSGFGALHLGAYREGRLRYLGRVGSGFRDGDLKNLTEALSSMTRKTAPCTGVPRNEPGTWVQPKMVVEVEYKALTREGRLRHPRFLRLREDKDARECTVDDLPPGDPAGGEPAAEEPKPPVEAAPKTVNFTNLNKVYWPDSGITKNDLIEYYRQVSPRLLPYLEDRPLVLTRYPDGIEGKSFYQKNAPDFIPGWIRTEAIWSGHSEREIKYLVCDDLETLLYIANSGAIPLHLWSSRVQSIQHPDWCILDLDPKGAPFADVVTLAKAIRKVCKEISLPAYVKTSGSTGLHVLLPLGRQCTYEQSRLLGHLIAKVIESRHGDIATTARHIPSRKGRVYLDYLQNRRGQLLVAPYSVRPLPGAPVSAPLEWREVNAKLDPRQFTLTNVLTRLKRKKRDPLLPVLTVTPDLVGALEALAALVKEA